MKKTLTVILLAAVAAAAPLAGAARTAGYRDPAHEIAGSKPGVGSGSNALLAGAKPGVGSGSNALLASATPGASSGTGV
jgi:hypothetical protein